MEMYCISRIRFYDEWISIVFLYKVVRGMVKYCISRIRFYAERISIVFLY